MQKNKIQIIFSTFLVLKKNLEIWKLLIATLYGDVSRSAFQSDSDHGTS